MKIVSCLHPKKIVTPSGAYVVPCGKCDACRNIHQSQWVQRLQIESQNHKYTYFVTLTYDDQHLPLCRLDNGYIYRYDDHCTFQYRVSQSHLDEVNDILYLKKHGSDFLPVVDRRDPQLFFKRLRININRYIKNEQSKKIRYFLCAEYGGKYKRPHYHAIIWFDNDDVAKSFEYFVSKSWQKGFINSQVVTSTAAQYVAKYVNGFDHLPTLFSLYETRPFILCSRKPIIGFSGFSSKEARKIVLSSAIKTTFYDPKVGKYVDVPLFRSFENKFFPRCKGFSLLSHTERILLYRLYRPEAERKLFNLYKALTDVDFYKSKSLILENVLKVGVLDPHHYLMYIPTHDRLQLEQIALKIGLYQENDNCIYYSFINALRLSKRLQLFALELSIDFDVYLTSIDEYYHKKVLDKFKQAYLYQSNFTVDHPDQVPSLIFFYPEFYKTVYSIFNELYDCLSLNLHNTFSVVYDQVLTDYNLRSKLSTFGIDVYQLNRLSYLKWILSLLDSSQSNEIKEFINVNKKIAYDVSKVKFVNDDFYQMNYIV